MTDQDDSLVLGTLRATKTELAELAEGNPIIRVPREEIIAIDYDRALTAERPLAQFAFGLLLTAPGFYVLPVLKEWLDEGGTIDQITLWFIFMIPIGLVAGLAAFRKGPLLRVTTKSGRRNLLLKGRHSPAEIMSFIKAAKDKFGYQIRILSPR